MAAGPQRITQKEIARVAGVNQSTVSLALSNHPRLSLATRKEVQRIARSLGYTPDPYLSGLSAYRNSRRPKQFQAVLAWVSNDDGKAVGWRSIETFVDYYRGAKERAEQLGYVLEEHCLHASKMSPKHLGKALRAKNVPGILFAPQQMANAEIDFPLEAFSAVTFGYTIRTPRVHRVTAHHFQAMNVLLQNIRSLGYRKPGFVLPLETDLRTGKAYSSTFLRGQLEFDSALSGALLLQHEDLKKGDFLKWYFKHTPDVIIEHWEQVYPWLQEEGIKVPEDVGMALLSQCEQGKFFSGICENSYMIGTRAAELLIDLIHRSEKGIPRIASTLLVEGSWIPGASLRPQRRSGPGATAGLNRQG